MRPLYFVILLLMMPLLSSLHEDNLISEIPQQNVIHDRIIAAGMKEESKLPSQHIIEMAIAGYCSLEEQGMLSVSEILTVIDYSLPSSEKRFWVFDVRDGRMLWHSLVAHGRNSGELYASRFSNIPGSHTSSEGFFLTGETYYGQHGLSLYLDGLEPGINHHARQRYIVIHSADYVTDQFVRMHGRLGRSHGCPAIPPEHHKEIIADIMGGSCLFIYAPCERYAERSPVLSGSQEV